MTFAQRVQQARTNIAEIVEVTRIGLALQNRQITAEQASAAITRIGMSQPTGRPEGGSRELVNA
jgi:uncharacterized membrane protein YjjP (DUF1212 family)